MSDFTDETAQPRVAYSHGRLIVRCVPGFTWIQFGLRRKWEWEPRGFWSVRGFAKSRRFGPVWVCTMRSDAIERGKRSGVFPPEKRRLITEPHDGHPDTEECPGCPHSPPGQETPDD